jgi:Glycosyltransferase
MPVKKYSKIAFISGTLGRGGAERQLYYLTTSLAKQGYKITVYCLTRQEFYESRLQENGIEVIYFGAHTSKLKRLYHLYRLLKSNPPQLIYSFHFYANTYAAIAGKLLGIKVIGSIRSDAISEKKLNGRMAWLHYSLPDYIVANSLHGAANCEKIFYKKKIFVLGNVIDTDIFQFVPKNISPGSRVNLLLVGRFEKEKQPWLFPEIIKKLKDAGLDVAGQMFGDGRYKQETTAMVSNEYMDYNISIHDMHADIQEVYKNAHWLCSLSKYEGTPNVVMEAMASGVGIAALNYPGIEMLIENEFNGLVEEKIDNLCNGIIKNSEAVHFNKITTNARDKIVEQYSLIFLVSRFEELLNKIDF